MGEVRDATAADAKAQEAEWEVAVLQASAQAQGNVPAGLARRIDEIKNPQVDWKSALRRFIQTSMARADYSWRQPNRRYLAAGLYLPELRSESMPPLVVAVDTSGSIDQGTLASFAAEVNAIADETRPERVHVIYCDAEIAREDLFEAGEPIVFNPAGGGGTDFSPVFRHAEAQIPDAACIVYLTDMQGTFPNGSEIPTLWVSTSEGVVGPFGETLEIRV
jgi:predicted metal-dependent peptidase